MIDCCANCKFNLELVKYDYSNGGCIHTKYDGYACMAFASEGQVTHMVGIDPEIGMCEMFCYRGGRDGKAGI